MKGESGYSKVQAEHPITAIEGRIRERRRSIKIGAQRVLMLESELRELRSYLSKLQGGLDELEAQRDLIKRWIVSVADEKKGSET